MLHTLEKLVDTVMHLHLRACIECIVISKEKVSWHLVLGFCDGLGVCIGLNNFPSVLITIIKGT